MKHSALLVGAILAMSCGGSNYYVIKNPESGQTYYTTDYKTLDNGAIQLTDAKTKSTVTLPTSAVQKVEKSEYDALLNAPAPAPAPASAPAAPAVTPSK
jgi:hypothetical protein